MRRRFLYFSVLSVLWLAVGCEPGFNDPASPGPRYEIEYRITDLDSGIQKITYVNEQGTVDSATDLSHFPKGSKIISVYSKPFHAQMHVHFYNAGSAPVQYYLQILVNHESKIARNIAVDPQVHDSAAIDYTLQ